MDQAVNFDIERRRELGEFLVQLRANTQPATVGLRGGGRRRVPGLRRHEVADLAGISLTWYTWLEQGRDIHISSDVLESIAQALGLDDTNRRHLRLLGGWPDTTAPAAPEEVDENLKALINDLLPSPAVITSPGWDYLAWNLAWSKVFFDPATFPKEHRNGLWITFMSADYRKRLIDWESEARYALARHRMIAAPYQSDLRLKAIRAELMESSPEFRRLWNLKQVEGFTGRVQSVLHPKAGLLQFKLIQLRPVDYPAIKLVIRRAHDSKTLNRMRKLMNV